MAVKKSSAPTSQLPVKSGNGSENSKTVTAGQFKTAPVQGTRTYDLSPPAGIAEQRLGPPNVQHTSEALSLINAAAIYLYRQARFAPITHLTPEVLTSQLSEWNVGTFRRYSLTMDAIENRDAITKSSTGKLKMSLSRRGYEIVKAKNADPAVAEEHARVLEDFYANVEATNAVDRNQRGGFSTLVHQMMDAALKRYAVHEIVWKPEADRLSATFVFVPLWFFESRTGALRFCGNFAWDGIPLKDGQWMVTVGDGIMECITVMWMYKTICIRDWLIYSEKNGMPLPIGKTPHQKDSPGWLAMKEAMEAIGSDATLLIGIADEIDKIEFGSSGQLPYPPFVEYCDKAIAAVARGADLSTISSAQNQEGHGASLQGDEADLIESHYGSMITETFNHYVDPVVLKWHFGENVVPAAYVKLNVPERKDTQLDIQVDKFLMSSGVRLGVKSALERYGRGEAEEDENALESSAPAFGSSPLDLAQRAKQRNNASGDNAQEEQDEQTFADEMTWKVAANAVQASRIMLRRSQNIMAHSVHVDLAPLRNRIEQIVSNENDAAMLDQLRKLRDDLPDMGKRINKNPRSQHALELIIGAMMLNGLVNAPAPTK